MCAALGTFGCTGQKLEGNWFGPLPLEDAKECRTQLFGNGRFTTYCKGEEWVGAGRYDSGPDTIRLKFDVLTRRGKVLSDPQPIGMTYVGHGNRIDLRWREIEMKWERRL